MKAQVAIFSLGFLAFLFASEGASWIQVSNAAGGQRVFFVEPKDGATVPPAFKMKFGEIGLKVEPAGRDVADKDDGHFHVIVDEGFYPEGQVIPADARHIHFGKAQMGGSLTLSPGPHHLTLQFADGAHRSDGERLSQTILIHVR